MRIRQRTSQPIYYRLYAGKSEMLDPYGNSLGEYEITYGDPVEINANISPATGESAIDLFGSLDYYDKVIQTCDMDCPVDENSVFYIDTAPVYDEIEKVWSAHDYVVKRIAKSVNTIRIAVAKVSVSNGEGTVISG